MSVPSICQRPASAGAKCSARWMAMEYASSPVELAALQMRNGSARRASACHCGNHRFAQKIKMLELAEKMRVVGGNPVNQKLQFLRALRASAADRNIRGSFPAVMPQPFGQPRGHQHPLVRPQMNAAALIDELAQKIDNPRPSAARPSIGPVPAAFCLASGNHDSAKAAAVSRSVV